MSHPSVSVVIANWNGVEFLRECLASLAGLDYPRDRLDVVVVDNCSTDDSVDYLRANHPGVVVIENDVNNYARANNRGIAATSSQYFALLNTDTRVEANWLRALVDCLEDNPGAAAVGSKVLFMDGKINSAGVESLPDFHWADLGFRQDDRGQFDTRTAVEGISGCSILIRRSAFDLAGPYDEDFEMYYEDVEYSLRLRAAGFELFYEPGSVVHHKYNGSIEKIPRSGQKDWYGERNRLFLVARHFPQELTKVAVRSRFFLYSSAEEFAHALPLLAKKWDSAESTAREDLVELLSSAKTEITRLQVAKERADAGIAHRETVIGEIQQASRKELERHKKLVIETRERLEGELAEVRKRSSDRISKLEEERDEARAKCAELVAAAQADRDRARADSARVTAQAFKERDEAREAMAATTDRLQGERDDARAVLATTSERLQGERDEARDALAKANANQARLREGLQGELEAARNAHGQEQRTRQEREVWIIALLGELKAHRELAEAELAFIKSARPAGEPEADQ